MKSNQIKIGALLSYISIAINIVISLVFTPIILRLLGQNEFGLYNLVVSIVSYLSLFNLGFASSYIRYYAKYKVNKEEDNISRLNGMFLIIFSVIGVVSLLAGIILVLNTNSLLGANFSTSEFHIAKILMLILVINMSISFPFTVFNSYITANEKYIFQKGLQIVKNLISPFVTLPMLLLGYGSIGMVIVTTILNITIELLNMLYSFKKLNIKFKFKSFDTKLMKEMSIYSSYIFINMIVDQANWNVDKFLIGRYKGAASVAVYGIAAQLNSYFMIFSTSISNVFTPKIHTLVEKKENKLLDDLFVQVGRIQFAIVFLISTGLIFFGKQFIIKWAGLDYSGAYIVTLFLILCMIIPLSQNLGIEIQRAKNQHKFRSALYLIIAVVNIFLSIPLTKKYGEIGAAIGTFISIVMGNVIIMNIYYDKKIGLDIKRFWKNILSILKSLFIPLIIGTIIAVNVDLYNTINLFIGMLSYSLLYLIFLWFFGMNEYEKKLIKKPLNIIRKKGKKI